LELHRGSEAGREAEVKAGGDGGAGAKLGNEQKESSTMPSTRLSRSALGSIHSNMTTIAESVDISTSID
jgi:hypothetical protein